MRATPGRVRLDDLLGVCHADNGVNHELLKEILVRFIEDNARRVRDLLDAAARGNNTAVRSAAHALKGSAALVGADRLLDLAADLEFRAANGTPHDATAAAEQLETEYSAVVETLRTLYPGLLVAR